MMSHGTEDKVITPPYGDESRHYLRAFATLFPSWLTESIGCQRVERRAQLSCPLMVAVEEGTAARAMAESAVKKCRQYGLDH